MNWMCRNAATTAMWRGILIRVAPRPRQGDLYGELRRVYMPHLSLLCCSCEIWWFAFVACGESGEAGRFLPWCFD